MPEPVTDLKSIEWLMKPLQELFTCTMFEILNNEDHTDWQIFVEFSEPRDGGLWQQFDVRGPLNKRFLTWAKNHYHFWIQKAHVPLRITNIINMPGGIPYPNW